MEDYRNDGYSDAMPEEMEGLEELDGDEAPELFPPKTDSFHQKQKRLDKLGEEYYKHKQDGDDAACQAKVAEIFALIFEMYANNYRVVSWYGMDTVEAAIASFFVGGFQKFDPAKGALSRHFQKSWKHLLKNEVKANMMLYTAADKDPQTEEGEEEKLRVLSLDEALGDDAANSPLLNMLQDERAEYTMHNTEEESAADEEFIHLVANMLTLPSLIGKKEYSYARVNTYRMLFTAAVTMGLKTDFEQVPVIERHERNVFRAFKRPFLDYYMSQECRGARKVAETPLKPYSETVKGRPDDETPLPIPNDVFCAYYERIEGTKKTEAAISMMRTKFREEFLPMQKDIDLALSQKNE